MCWKKSLLVIYNILGQLVNMLTTDDKYYLLKGDNLTEPIQMQLSKIKVFSNVLTLKKILTLKAYVFP